MPVVSNFLPWLEGNYKKFAANYPEVTCGVGLLELRSRTREAFRY